MNVTVAICTWNRAELLDQTLTQMHKLLIPVGLHWELLVVNNNCTDHTDDVIAKHSDALPIRRLFESKQGLSHSRNCALKDATGELLIWTDDDVLVDQNWLATYANAATDFPEYHFFGGPVEPWFESQPPRWLPSILNQVASAYAVVNHGSKSIDFTTTCLPFGANFAVRTQAQQGVNFNTNLGRVGNSMVSGEETAFLSALIASGHAGRYLPNAKVRHFIPSNRQNLRYLRRYYGGHGVLMRSQPQMQQATQLFGRPKWLYKAWLLSELKYRASMLTSPPETWIKHFKTAATWRGAFWNKA